MVTVSLYFDDKEYEDIKKVADLYGVSTTDFIKNSILEDLEDELDYIGAIQSERESNNITHPREVILEELELSDG